MADPKGHFSFTQLDMLSKCGEQYQQVYVLKRRMPPGVAALVGRSVDKTTTQNLASKMKGEGLLPAEAIADLARDHFNAEWQRGEVSLLPEEAIAGVKIAKGEGVDKAVRLAKLHARKFAPEIEPTHLQRKVVIELPGYPLDLEGYIDIQEGWRSLRDTKTSHKAPKDDTADKSDQLTIYAMAVRVVDGFIPEKVCLDFLVDTDRPRAIPLASKRTEEDFKPVLRRLETAFLAIEKGVFVPARETDWFCCPMYCGFFGTCKYTKKTRRPLQ